MSIRGKVAEIRRGWPHPWWAGFKRKTWKVRLTSFVSASGLTWAAHAIAVGNVLPDEDLRVVGILVSVLAAMAILVIVLARTSAQMFNQLGLLLKRESDRDGDGVKDGEAGVLVNVNGSSVFEYRLKKLEDADKDLSNMVTGMRADILSRVDEHHTLAMEFLSRKTADLSSNMSVQMTREIMNAKDALKQAFKEALDEIRAEGGLK